MRQLGALSGQRWRGARNGAPAARHVPLLAGPFICHAVGAHYAAMPSPFSWLFPPCKQCAQLLGAVNDLRTQLAGITDRLTHMETHIMSALSDLQTDVTNEDTVIGSAVTLINGFAAKLDAAIAEAQAGNDKALTDLSTDVKAQAATLAAAVAANTPAAPAPTP